MSDTGRDSKTSPGLLETLTDDVRSVHADLRQHGWKRPITSAFADIEGFYLTEYDRGRLREMSALGRWLHRVWWLLKSLLLKLTPVRRVLLAIALLVVATGEQRFQFGASGVTISLVGVGEILLLVILLLELKDKLVARRELEAGRAVQLALLPGNMPFIRGWDLWLHTEPANDVGGDLVDHMRIDDRRHGVALGDVAGKALPAALLMVKLQATLRALVPTVEGLGELGGAVNHILQRDGLPNRFATLVYIVLREGDGELRMLNAGHLPPVIVRNGMVERLSPGSMALGLIEGATFEEQALQLAEGDTLIAFSDGVSEASDASGRFFGDERLGDVIEKTAGQTASAIGQHVLEALHDFMGEGRPHDDVSLMVLRRVRTGGPWAAVDRRASPPERARGSVARREAPELLQPVLHEGHGRGSRRGSPHHEEALPVRRHVVVRHPDRVLVQVVHRVEEQ